MLSETMFHTRICNSTYNINNIIYYYYILHIVGSNYHTGIMYNVQVHNICKLCFIEIQYKVISLSLPLSHY